jgi:hypothetical protein
LAMIWLARCYPMSMPTRPAVMVRTTERDRERLLKLRRILPDLDQAAITRRAWAHLLATLERGEPVHLTIPSEAESGR